MALVIVLSPACATREKHLRGLLEMIAALPPEMETDIRLLAWDGVNEENTRMDLPPTTLVGLPPTGAPVMYVGSIGDAGIGPHRAGSLNIMFHPDDVLLNEWRKWFQYTSSSAVPLNEASAAIPYLVPPEGDPEALLEWKEYLKRCRWADAKERQPVVDPKTGEVTEDAQGKPVEPWDDGRTALDPLAAELQRIYANGWLVTVDESTRIKPLAIPLKATLLGQRAERTVGAVKQKQAFTLQVLDDKLEKAVEKCRSINDVVEMLSHPLSIGNRWLTERAADLLEREVEARNERGHALLIEALGGRKVDEFIAFRTEAIRRDVDDMYRQLGQGDRVPEGKFLEVLAVIKCRMNDALDRRITPRPVFNRISAPSLMNTDPDENWNQPLGLMLRSAKALRKHLVDPYYRRSIHGMAFTEEEYLSACDPFKDACLQQRDYRLVEQELTLLEEMMRDDERSAKERCGEVWKMMKGQAQ